MAAFVLVIFLIVSFTNLFFNNFSDKTRINKSEAALNSCSYKKVFWK